MEDGEKLQNESSHNIKIEQDKTNEQETVGSDTVKEEMGKQEPVQFSNQESDLPAESLPDGQLRHGTDTDTDTNKMEVS